MKKLLFTLALLVSFSSFGQTADEYLSKEYYEGIKEMIEIRGKQISENLYGGTYQVERVDNSYATIVVLNTETGVMKSYLTQTIGGIPQWAENPNGYLPETTFTH